MAAATQDNSTLLPWLDAAACVPAGLGADRLPRGTDPRQCSDLMARLLHIDGPHLSNHSGGHDAVDGVVLVHYSRAPCRKRDMLAQLRQAGLPWHPPRLQLAEHLDADAFTPQLVSRCVARPLCTDVELSQASCTANHVYSWHLAVAMGWQRTLVLEDDVGLPAHFHAQLRHRLASLPPGWLILNFACSGSEHGTGSVPCSRGYVLSAAGARVFRRHAGIVDHGADWLIFELSAKVEQLAAEDAAVPTHRGGIAPIVERSRLHGQQLPRGTDICGETGESDLSDTRGDPVHRRRAGSSPWRRSRRLKR